MMDEWSEPMGSVWDKGTVCKTDEKLDICKCGKPSVVIRIYEEGPKGLCLKCSKLEPEPYIPPRYEWDQITNKPVRIK